MRKPGGRLHDTERRGNRRRRKRLKRNLGGFPAVLLTAVFGEYTFMTPGEIRAWERKKAKEQS